MEPTGKTVAVVGATGLQGRAVTRHLLGNGRQVRALTRDPAGAPASTGAQIVRARTEDVSSMIAATDGVYGMFGVRPTVGSPGTAPGFSVEDEVRWGINVAELGLPATILRPVSCMENFTGEYARQDGALATAVVPGVPRQIMAVDEVGFVTALAFSRSEERIGREVALAGGELTPVRIAAAVECALGRPLPCVRILLEAVRALGEDFAFAYGWHNGRGCRADLPATRRIHPGAMNFRTWPERTGAARIAAFPAARPAVEQYA